MADCVEKLENRGASKFSQMSHVDEFSHARLYKIDTGTSERFCGE
jgi:hypothetical protein